MPLACNARRRASVTPKLGGAQQPPSYESMMEAAEPTAAPTPATSTTRVSSKNQRFGVTPYGAAAPLDGGPTPAERKAALLKKRQSLAVMSRFSHTGGRGVTYSGSSSNEENRPLMAGGAAEAPGARGPLKPRAASVNVMPVAVNTNIVKPTTGAYISVYTYVSNKLGRMDRWRRPHVHMCIPIRFYPPTHTSQHTHPQASTLPPSSKRRSRSRSWTPSRPRPCSSTSGPRSTAQSRWAGGCRCWRKRSAAQAGSGRRRWGHGGVGVSSYVGSPYRFTDFPLLLDPHTT